MEHNRVRWGEIRPAESSSGSFIALIPSTRKPEEGLSGTWEAKDGTRVWLGQLIERAVKCQETLAGEQGMILKAKARCGAEPEARSINYKHGSSVDNRNPEITVKLAQRETKEEKCTTGRWGHRRETQKAPDVPCVAIRKHGSPGHKHPRGTSLEVGATPSLIKPAKNSSSHTGVDIACESSVM